MGEIWCCSSSSSSSNSIPLRAGQRQRQLSFHNFITTVPSNVALSRSCAPRAGVRILPKCASSDLSLLSSSQCSDGSFLFRFGRKEEVKNGGERQTSSDQAPSEGGGVDPSHPNSEMNSSVNLISESSINLEAVDLDTKTSDANGVPASAGVVAAVKDDDNDEEDESIVVSNDDGVVNEEMGTGDFDDLGNPANVDDNEPMAQLTSSETLAAVRSMDTETSDLDEGPAAADDDDEDSGKSANTVSQIDDNDIGSDSKENPMDVSENDAITQLPKSEASIEQGLDGLEYQAISNEDVEFEGAHPNGVGTDGSVVSTERCDTTTETRDSSSMIQETSEAQLIDSEEMTSSAVDGYDDRNKANSSIVLDDSSSTSTLEEQLVDDKASENDITRSSIPEVVGINSVAGTASRAGFVLYSGVAFLPHPSKALSGGENAHFVACQNWLGVADGVGHWSLEGIYVGSLSRELMQNCKRIVSDYERIPMNKPEEVLIRSAREAQSPGSSTVLVAYFDGQALHVANIGDSGFIIIRDGAVVQRSSHMLHEINFPFQIQSGHDPSELMEVYQIELDEGDVIITATGGLFDNLYEQEIASITSKSLESNMKPQEIAECLANRAQAVGQSTSTSSPFADAAKAAGYVKYTGGKLDDVTVIVSLVQKISSSHL